MLFINPPVWRLQATHYRLNRPLGAPLLCSILKNAGHDAYFIDAEALRWGDEQIQRLGRAGRPDVVGMTVLYHNRWAARELLRKLKTCWPGARFLAGGPFAATNPDDLLMWGFDAVCLGEGEDVILDMLIQPGDVFRQTGLTDLDTLPLPSHGLCIPGLRAYQGNEPRFEHPEAVMMWTRGCPFPCQFCSNPVYRLQKPRLMSAPRIIEELLYLKGLGVRHVFVYSDELVGASPAQNRWIQEVCQAIAPLDLTYKTQGRCHPGNDLPTMEALKTAGFRAVQWGVESLSQRVLKNLGKGITPEDSWNTLRLAHRAGLKNYVFIMVGGLGEETTDFEATRKGLGEMVREGLVDYLQVSIMTAEPGSPLWDTASREGWSRAETGRSHFEPTFTYPWADAGELSRRKRTLDALMG
ncbi:MAG: B12-binding domain-containing radical SAM protein [Chloroflexi bacterium]|nr:B12-binding domain-containing radical SAM protein [Chloroflexota bacterium]